MSSNTGSKLHRAGLLKAMTKKAFPAKPDFKFAAVLLRQQHESISHQTAQLAWGSLVGTALSVNDSSLQLPRTAPTRLLPWFKLNPYRTSCASLTLLPLRDSEGLHPLSSPHRIGVEVDQGSTRIIWRPFHTLLIQPIGITFTPTQAIWPGGPPNTKAGTCFEKVIIPDHSSGREKKLKPLVRVLAVDQQVLSLLDVEHGHLPKVWEMSVIASHVILVSVGRYQGTYKALQHLLFSSDRLDLQ